MTKKQKHRDISGNVQIGNGMQNTVAGTNYAVMGKGNIYGPSKANLPAELRNELEVLRSAIEELRLTASERARAQEQLQAVEDALTEETPNKSKAAEQLQNFAMMVKETGGVVAAGSSIAAAIGTIASWLGPLGAGIISRL